MDSSHKSRSSLSLFDGRGWVVGIGSSAGGLEALTQFVTHLPPQFAGTVVIAQHLAPHSKSMMVELLARHSPLPVVPAQNNLELKPATVYVVTPNHDIDVSEGRMVLRVAGDELRPKPSVNEFFASLAQTHGARSVGIILSGTGTDGSQGIQAIKAVGGLTLAQDDSSAKYDGMPRSAIDTGSVDSILPPGEIAKNILSILQNHEVRHESVKVSESRLGEIFKIVLANTGTDFSRYKPSTMQRRVAKRMSELHLADPADYVKRLGDHSDEAARLSQELLISVTSFFRDPELWAGLEPYIEQMLVAKHSGQEFRAWVAGCATGEEAYTLAILVVMLSERAGKSLPIKIFATDIDQDALLEARTAIYNERSCQLIPEPIRARFFHRREDGGLEVAKRIRDLVVFARHDIAQNPPFVKIDLVTCRNVMIYFEPDLQKRVLEMFHYALLPKGYLFMGRSESVSVSPALFESEDRKAKIFKRTMRAAQLTTYAPTGPIATEKRAARTLAAGEISFSQRRAETGRSLVDVATSQLMKTHELAAVVVDEQQNVVQIIGDVTRFLALFSGQADLRLPSLLAPETSAEISVLIRSALRDGKPKKSRAYAISEKSTDKAAGTKQASKKVSKKSVKTSEHGAYTVVAEPLFEHEQGAGRSLVLVSFSPQKTRTRSAAVGAVSESSFDHARMNDLEIELHSTREHLQSVVEELGVTNEELQALNEELSSTNEELQASNEELETTNEELQSANEELTTVNEELAVKTSELKALNNSLENIQNSLSSAMVVVDAKMRVTLFNQDAIKIFEISPSDVGREISNLSAKCEIPDFIECIETTLRTGRQTDALCEVGSAAYQMRIYPSFTDVPGSESGERRRVTGAIVFFFDNTELLRTRDRLTQSELRVRAIINSAPSLIFLKDSLGRYLTVNESYCRFTGFSEKDMIGKTDREILPERMARQLRDGDLEALLKRTRTKRNEELVDFEGNRHVFLCSRFPLSENSDAEPYAIGTIAIDLTALVDAQNALTKSEQRYRSIIEDQAVLVCRHAPDGTITFVNSVISTIYGGAPESYVGRDFRQLIEPDFMAAFDSQLATITPESPIVQHETPIRRAARDRWMRWIHRGIFDAQGTLIEFQAVGFDVTDYRKETNDLLRKDAVFSLVFQNTSDAIAVFRLVGGQFVLDAVNQSAQRGHLDVSSSMVGRPLHEILSPLKANATLTRYNRVATTGQSEIFEEEIPSYDSRSHDARESHYVLTTLVPIPTTEGLEKGQTDRIVALSRDISSYKTIENDLRRAKDAAEVANRAKSDFLATMSHELRTPLNVVLGMAQILEASDLNEQQRQFSQSIRRSGQALLTLIEDILDVSKIEAGKIHLDALPFAVSATVDETLSMFKMQADQKGVQLELDYHRSADIQVIGDPNRLRQVLVNLISNALKFTDSGGKVRVIVSAEKSAAQNVGIAGEMILKFAVSDSGVGIRKEEESRLFKRFSQLESGLNRRYGGTGLGLVISKHLVELMGGEINFESEYGRGTTFRFYVRLPFVAQNELRQLEGDAQHEMQASGSLLPRPLKILAVDDNRDSQQVIDIFLKRMGHKTELASSAEEAISKIRKDDFDLVLMDVQMPGMNGYEATQKIRGLPKKKREVPIIALTANAMTGDAKKCIEAGMNDYLTKPIQTSALQVMLTRWGSKTPPHGASTGGR